VYDLQGRLVCSKIVTDNDAVDLLKKNIAGNVLLVKIRTLK
jgi:hypothetical protein